MNEHYMQGYNAYNDGMDLDDNPFQAGEEYDQWESGWVQASDEQTH